MSGVSIIDQLPDAVLIGHADRFITEWNAAAEALLEVSSDELRRLRRASELPWRMLDRNGEKLAVGQGPLSRAISGESTTGEYVLVTYAGTQRCVWIKATPLRDAEGQITGGIMVLRDVSEQRLAVEALRESEERYRRLVELCPDPIVVHSAGRIVFANPAACDLVAARTDAELLGREVLEFVDPSQHELVMERVRTAIATQESSGMVDLRLIRLDGEMITVETTTMPVTYQGGPAIQAVLRDITERKRAEEALEHQALHDALTGLPNRVLLRRRLTEALETATQDGSTLGLLLLDLDRFKEVNDTLGHQAGDALLQQVGARLRGALTEADTIARLGGDEFAAIVPSTDCSDLGGVIDKVLHVLQVPFALEGQPIALGASIGVALAPEHGLQADSLLRRADVAMYVAKRSGGGVSYYAADQDRHSPDRLMFIGELRQALEEGDVVLFFQPKIDVVSNALTGVEALARWQQPLRGLISPDQFIPVAEQAGLIDVLSRSVLMLALRQIRAWRRAGLEIPVAVNLSMRNLHDQALPDMIAGLLEEFRVPPRLLSLEITESSLMADPARTRTILERLRAMGLKVAIDDFGTGHASLTYLKHLPADELKIDRSFIQNIVTDASDRLIVRATIDLAHSLGLRVIAEGVEDVITRALLADLGCDEAQGFLISRPLPGPAVTHWLWERQRANYTTPQAA